METMGNLIKELREKLTPHNPDWVNRVDYDIVKMGIHTNYGYMCGDTIRDAIDVLENRAKVVLCGIDEFNNLEKLGIILLLESAYMMKPSK